MVPETRYKQIDKLLPKIMPRSSKQEIAVFTPKEFRIAASYLIESTLCKVVRKPAQKLRWYGIQKTFMVTEFIGRSLEIALTMFVACVCKECVK